MKFLIAFVAFFAVFALATAAPNPNPILSSYSPFGILSGYPGSVVLGGGGAQAGAYAASQSALGSQIYAPNLGYPNLGYPNLGYSNLGYSIF